MKALLVVACAAGCATTFTDHFLEVTPVRATSLAGKTLGTMDGTSCKSVCTSKRDFDGIDYCAIATFDVNPRLVCSIHHIRSSPEGVDIDWLVDVPANVDVATLPRTGTVPIALCEAAGCKKHLEHDKESITACAVYPYRPDETEPYLVCSFNDERKAETM